MAFVAGRVDAERIGRAVVEIAERIGDAAVAVVVEIGERIGDAAVAVVAEIAERIGDALDIDCQILRRRDDSWEKFPGPWLAPQDCC